MPNHYICSNLNCEEKSINKVYITNKSFIYICNKCKYNGKIKVKKDSILFKTNVNGKKRWRKTCKSCFSF